ncbi:DUF805 domain-containing protein [Xanthobacteraceae bacterium Astr-EGSB]|uniref:DUF805 domain-containing protein n=1 Tax=Astrobacterium formosum TaxID=3069710 RepID=UPI0027B0B129|nr:DUF805 domain-containing protein [Xanthobacteraceae bacterium Astr-EGSB]
MQALDWSYLFLSFDGRIGRRAFWAAFLAVAALELACHLVVYRFEDGERMSAIVSLAFAYPEFAVFAKRGQDRNISPYVIGAFFVLSTCMDFLVVTGLGGSTQEPDPVLVLLSLPWIAFALALLVELGLRRGTVGPNRYGPDPLTSSQAR